MKRTRLVAAAAIGALAFAASAIPAFGDGSGTVDATVTPATPCITLDASSVNFGTLPFSTSSSSASVGVASPGIIYTNCSSQEEKVYGRGSDATGGTGTWSLTNGGVCPGLNRYGLDLVVITASVSNQIPMTTADTLLTTTPAGGPQPTRLALFMPCTGSTGAGEQMQLHVTYTATF